LSLLEPPTRRESQIGEVTVGSGETASEQSGRLRLTGALEHQVVRFALVGVVNSIFGFGVFAGLQIGIGAHVHYLIILVIAHVISVLEAYVLQRYLVFQVTGRWWRDLARFWSVYLVALAINAPALSLLVEVAHMAVLPAQALIMLVTAMGTFFAHRGFTFRRGGRPAGAAEPREAALDLGPRAATPPVPSQDHGDAGPSSGLGSWNPSPSRTAAAEGSKSEGIAT